MPAYAAIATERGYTFCGGQPTFEDDTKIAKPAKAQTEKSSKKASVSASVGTFASMSRVRATRFFKKIYFWDALAKAEENRDSHGRHGRKKQKARQLSH